MRKFMVLLIGLLVLPALVQAHPSADIHHSHKTVIIESVEEREHQEGVGVDVILYESDNALLEEVRIEEKYDFVNEENSVYLVAQVNLFKLFKKYV